MSSFSHNIRKANFDLDRTRRNSSYHKQQRKERNARINSLRREIQAEIAPELAAVQEWGMQVICPA